MASITVYPGTLRQAVSDSNEDPRAIAAVKSELAELPQWLDRNEPFPLSFTKISQLGKALHVPFGYLVRAVAPEEKAEPLLRYRTINNAPATVSRELTDLLQIMHSRQDWAHGEMVAGGLASNEVVNSMAGVTNPKVLGLRIREVLQMENKYIISKPDTKRFNYVRQQASNAGFMVMVDSMVPGTRRRLDIHEFRAFVLNDDMAPLIFINRNDAHKAMLFSLLHEIGHILMGTEELYDADDGATNVRDVAMERLINRAVIYAMITDNKFQEEWNRLVEQGHSVEDTARTCAQIFGLSAVALTIHAVELGLTDESGLNAVKSMTQLNAHSDEKQTGGGNQNLTNAYHLDQRYVEMVHDSVTRGTLPFTDGLALLGVHSLKAYDGLMKAKRLVQ